ncbi:MAG: aminotransferase class III-fold pyridoxal phosphate-dependent enzyme [Cyclobacteriaceae bacterium]|nr:aminotransferase class III-fold pyridoxal phosphate-dependent enzyme [Cyclobacteriaceae bacterium]
MATQQEQYDKARKVMPGGVNSSTRLLKTIGAPFYASHGKGSWIMGVDGKEYVDMCCAHGSGLLGNAHPAIGEALRKATEIGYVNAFETVYHEELASFVVDTVACADKVRFCSSGSEATLHLIRACRGYTGKDKIIRVEGHFHGYHEMIYIGGHPPQSEFQRNRDQPYIESAGIPQQFAELIIPIPYNDKEALKEAIYKHADETALVILEPVNFNCAGIRADEDYLQLVRELTAENNIILFFDEIQSAYKNSFQAAQSELGIIPDVTTIGKSIGGGLPLSAFCGKKEIMDSFSPIGKVEHSGTFNAHLVPILAGLAFMKEASAPDFYSTLQKLETQFHSGINKIIKKHDLNMVVPNFGARFNILLGRKTPARNYEETFCHDNLVFLSILKDCFEKGVFFHDYGGGPAHHGYSIQHTSEDIDFVLKVLEEALLKHKDRF